MEGILRHLRSQVSEQLQPSVTTSRPEQFHFRGLRKCRARALLCVTCRGQSIGLSLLLCNTEDVVLREYEKAEIRNLLLFTNIYTAQELLK